MASTAVREEAQLTTQPQPQPQQQQPHTPNAPLLEERDTPTLPNLSPTSPTEAATEEESKDSEGDATADQRKRDSRDVDADNTTQEEGSTTVASPNP